MHINKLRIEMFDKSIIFFTRIDNTYIISWYVKNNMITIYTTRVPITILITCFKSITISSSKCYKISLIRK